MREKEQLNVVSDQVGAPTWARGLAEAIWKLIDHPEAKGIYHWSDDGVCSWYDFAVAIQQVGLANGLLTTVIPIKPISTAEYPTPAKRPAFSALDSNDSHKLLNIEPLHWKKALHKMMKLL